MNSSQLFRSLRLAAFGCAVSLLSAHSMLAEAVQPGDVDLSPTPPDLTSSVDPNIVVTFDDSGSMASDFMGDNRPFDQGSWNGPWRCAGQIDPTITDPLDMRSKSMNGVFYNPGVTYLPPLRKDGTAFPNASASLTAVWRDGVTANRPNNPSGSGSTTNLFRGWSCGWNANPNGGTGLPYYYVLNTGVDIGTPAAPNTANLYNSANWHAVIVQPAEYQNFANWYAYYHTRNLMTRTALSRVFGGLGENLRVAWQNINDGTYLLPASTIITNLTDTNTTGNAAANNYRTNFFDWIFQTGASGGTPDRAATIRAGEFFKRGNGNTGGTGNLRDPYWEPARNGAPARELSCRQNFHMLVTDGYWNEGDPALPGGSFGSNADHALPPGGVPVLPAAFDYSASAPESRIYWNVTGANYASSLANIAFYYWASDLRSDLDNTVPPYYPDKSTNVDGTGTLAAGANPEQNKVIFFNPANDSARWQHVVQFMVTLGVAGTLNFPQDLQALRLGTKTWPRPVNNSPQAIDDTWHAAINSRGSYFSASNPQALITHLTDIINAIIVRKTSSTAIAVTLPITTSGTAGFKAGYDTSEWSGFLVKTALDGTGTPEWDAGCILTGGGCPSTGQTGLPVTDPNARVIVTSNGLPGTGKPFRWGSLTAAQQATLNVDPSTLQLQLIPPQWVNDTNGPQRLDYLRGSRVNESVAPLFRRRASVLGPIVNAQPVYVSSPTDGYTDSFPAGSPEATAAASGNSFSKFVYDNRNRPPTVYAAANDGMLHAFDASTGQERWAYVPAMLFDNFKLDELTDTGRGLVPSVDDQPLVQSVFINGQWRTVLIGSMRFGARGIYVLDVTNPAGVSEAGASALPMWEFTFASAGGSHLGYTYTSQNIARLHNGRWVVLVSSGYYPKDSLDPASRDASANQTSLFVIDLATGALIREISTGLAPQAGGATTYGLSTPAVYDFGSDQIDEVAVAGDLIGNLWRFDLSDPSPSNWKVDLMFKDYGGGQQGNFPITVMPVAMRDPGTRGTVWIFGTGKFLGLEDRTSSIPMQSFFGVQDRGTASPDYPISTAMLQTQTLSQSGGGFRSVTTNTVSSAQRGWTIPLNVASEPGERNVITATPLDSSNRAILTTLIPKSDDPCEPGRRGAIMVVDAATGGAPDGPPPVTGAGAPPANSAWVGQVFTSEGIPVVGSIPTVIPNGGGGISIPGIPGIQISDNYWHRGAWRELLDLL